MEIYNLLSSKKSQTIHNEEGFCLDNGLYNYEDLLNRLVKILDKNTPNSVSKDKLIIQPPKIAREGSKKTIFLNFEETCLKLRRENDHVLSYISTELGTNASIQDGGGLVLRGKFQPKGIENILRNYINEYVLCGSCKSADTYFKKDEMNKLCFLQCEICKAFRFINPIRPGFMAQTKRKKKNQR
nr:translation initiation factor eiF2 beta-subunit [Cryptomonas sp.]